MKIRSNFKDYYDYVEYLYSPEGGDYKELYLRVKLGHPEQSGNDPLVVDKGKLYFPSVSPRRYWTIKDKEEFPWKFKWCVVAGKRYLLVTDSKDYFQIEQNSRAYKLVTPDHPCLDEISVGAGTWVSSLKKFKYDVYESSIGVKSQSAFDLSKRLETPVFTIRSPSYHHGDSSILVDSVIPNLGELGFAKIMTPERMYQEISMFLNLIRDNPDSDLPVSVSEKDRLVQKGFDPKISFRNNTLKKEK